MKNCLVVLRGGGDVITAAGARQPTRSASIVRSGGQTSRLPVVFKREGMRARRTGTPMYSSGQPFALQKIRINPTQTRLLQISRGRKAADDGSTGSPKTSTAVVSG